MLNFVENLLENEMGPMNDQDLTKTDHDPDRSLVLIGGLSHFLTNFLQNLASCQTSFNNDAKVSRFFDGCKKTNFNKTNDSSSRTGVSLPRKHYHRSISEVNHHPPAFGWVTSREYHIPL
jgi:hypothetical protein